RFVRIAFVGLEFGQRLYAATRLFLRIGDELLQLVVLAGTAGQHAREQAQRTEKTPTVFLFRKHIHYLCLRCVTRRTSCWSCWAAPSTSRRPLLRRRRDSGMSWPSARRKGCRTCPCCPA